MKLEECTREQFEKHIQAVGLSGAKGLLKEIYEAKSARGRSWDVDTIAKVERFETRVRKMLQMRGILSKKEQVEFQEYMKGLQGRL